MRFELDEILTIIDRVKQTELDLFEYKDQDVKLKIRGKQNGIVAVPQNVSMGTGADAQGVMMSQNGHMLGAAGMQNMALPGMMMSQNGNLLGATGLQNMAASGQQVSAGMLQEAGADAAAKQEGIVIESPMVGTFYAAPSQDAEPFVKVGDHVKKGQTVGIVEAMKLMNEIEAECDGIVTEILVKNEQMVEYGQPLVRILEA